MTFLLQSANVMNYIDCFMYVTLILHLCGRSHSVWSLSCVLLDLTCCHFVKDLCIYYFRNIWKSRWVNKCTVSQKTFVIITIGICHQCEYVLPVCFSQVKKPPSGLFHDSVWRKSKREYWEYVLVPEITI